MRERSRRGRINSEINITPFTDVVLVLLVIFMITTPLLIQSQRSSAGSSDGSSEGGFSVQLPQAKGMGLPAGADHVVVAILQDGRMVVSGEEVTEEFLKARLEKVKAQNPQTLVIVQADRMVNHWRVVRAMDIAASVGLSRLAIATVEE
jgi:biopolymer transport protein ExbD